MEQDMINLQTQSTNYNDIEKQLHDTEEALHIALQNKDELEIENARLQALLQEKDLTHQHSLLEKDIEIVDLQLKNITLSNNNENLAHNIQKTEQYEIKLNEYKKCLDELKSWGIMTFVNFQQASRHLEEERSTNEELMAHIQKLQENVAWLQNQVITCNELMVSYDALWKEASKFEDALMNDCVKHHRKCKVYLNAFEQLKRMFIEQKTKSEEHIQQQKHRITDLVTKLNSKTTCVHPRWQETYKNYDKNKLLLAEELKSQNIYLSYTLVDLQKNVFCVNAFRQTSSLMQVYDAGLSILRLLYKVDSLLHFLFITECIPRVEEATKNSLASSKDNYSLWLHYTISHLCEVQYWLSIIIEGIRMKKLDQVEQFFGKIKTYAQRNTDNQKKISDGDFYELCWCDLIQSGEKDVNLLMNLAFKTALTPSFDTSVFQRFVQQIKQFWETFEKSLESTETGEEEDESHPESMKIKPPLLLASLRKLNSLSVLAVCNFSGCQDTLKEISSSTWIALYEGTSYLFKKIPFGYASKKENVVSVSEKNILTLGFGDLVLSRKNMTYGKGSELIQFINQMVDSLNSLLLCTPPHESTNVTVTGLKRNLQIVGEAMKVIDQSCDRFVTPFSVNPSNPWETLVGRIVTSIHEFEVMNKMLEMSQVDCKEKDTKIQTLQNDIHQLTESVEKWKSKFAETHRELERMHLYKIELQDLRGKGAQLIQLLKNQAEHLQALQEEKKQLTRENTVFQCKIEDMKRLLEKFKELPDYFGQTNDWMIRELTNLKIINKKLQSALLSVQIQAAKEWLPDDLSYDECVDVAEPNPFSKNELHSTPLFKDYWSLRREIFQYLLSVPWPLEETTFEEACKQWKDYQKTGSKLTFHLKVLKHKIDWQITQSRLLSICCCGICSNPSSTATQSNYFGPISVLNRPHWSFISEVQNILRNKIKLPLSMRIVTTEPPVWVDRRKAPTYKLVGTPAQLCILRDLLHKLLQKPWKAVIN